MKKRFFTFLALLTMSFGTVAARAQQQQQQQPLPTGYTVVELPKDDQKRLSNDQKDSSILSLQAQVLQANIATAQAQLANVQTSYNAWVVSFRVEVEEVRKKNKFGDDVNFDFQRMQFVKGAKPEKKAEAKPVPADKKADPVK